MSKLLISIPMVIMIFHRRDLVSLMLEANTLCPLFFLTFEIFNYNVHNCLVDSGASVSIMPLFVAKKINDKWDKVDAHII